MIPYTRASEKPEKKQARDDFETPDYAVDILFKYIPDNIRTIWEPASGSGRVVRRLADFGFSVISSDIAPQTSETRKFNFLSEEKADFINYDNLAIITNPPYSIRNKFVDSAFKYGVPFAFLISSNYSSKTIRWLMRGCQKIVPTRRINFITPNATTIVHENEVWEISKKDEPRFRDFKSYSLFKKSEDPTLKDLWGKYLEKYQDVSNYTNRNDIPQKLIEKYSSSQFHTMWLTWGFNLPERETYVELRK